MNRLCLALLLAVTTAVVANNVVPEDPAVLGAADLGGCELDDNICLMETVPESRGNLVVGAVSPDSRQLAVITHRVGAATFLINDQDITFRGPEFTNITAIWVNRMGASQGAVPSIKAGGLGDDFVTIRILGTRGFGFEYTITINGAINCSNS